MTVCSVTSEVNVTINVGNDPRVIKEPVGYNQTGFIIMESHLPYCADGSCYFPHSLGIQKMVFLRSRS